MCNHRRNYFEEGNKHSRRGIRALLTRNSPKEPPADGLQAVIGLPFWIQALGAIGGVAAGLFWKGALARSTCDLWFASAATLWAFLAHEPFHWIALRAAEYPARMYIRGVILPRMFVSSPSLLRRPVFACALAAPLGALAPVGTIWAALGNLGMPALLAAAFLALGLWTGDGYCLCRICGFPPNFVFLDRGRSVGVYLHQTCHRLPATS